MANEQRTLIDRLETIEEKVDSLLDQKSKVIIPINVSQEEKVKAINFWLYESKKEHFWFGTKEDFNKKKKFLLIFNFAIIVVAVLSTLFTSLAANLYGTFTFFENIWGILSCFILYYIQKMHQRIPDSLLKKYSTDTFMRDEDRTWHPLYKEKTKYKIFRILALISAILNIIYMLLIVKNAMSFVSITFEVLFFVLVLIQYFTYNKFYTSYGIFIFYTGKNMSNINNTSVVTIVMDRKLENVYFLDDFNKKYFP